MTTEAALHIRPTLLATKGGTGPIRRELQTLERQQQRTFSRGERAVQTMERAIGSVGRTLVRTQFGIKEIESSFMVLERIGRSAMAGGRTIFDAFISPNATLQNALTTFNVLIGDTQKAAKLVADLRAEAAATPFEQSELIEGSKRLLRLTGDNIDMNKDLLRVAQTMAAINPSKNVTDAAEALLDAQSAQFERLREFGIRVRKEDAKRANKEAKKNGRSFGNIYIDAVSEAIRKQSGGRDIVGELGKTFSGRTSTLRDIGKNLGREIGEPAFEILSDGLGDFNEQLSDLTKNPEFKRDLEDLKAFGADVARAGVEMAKRFPEGVRWARETTREFREFWDNHGTKIMILAGGLAADRFTNGAVSRGVGALGSAGFSGGRRLLFGRRSRGGGGGSALTNIAGATPVYVVNMGEGIGNLAGGGAARKGSKALTAAELATVGKGGGGLMTSIGGAGLASGGLIAGSFLAGLAVFADATERTRNGVAAVPRMQAADARRNAMFSKEELAARDRRGVAAANSRKMTMGIRQAAEDGDWAKVAAIAETVVARHGDRGLAAINEQIAFDGTQFKKGKNGRLKPTQSPALMQKRDELLTFYDSLRSDTPGGKERFKEAMKTGEFDRKNAEANRLADLIESQKKTQAALEQALKQRPKIEIHVHGEPTQDTVDRTVGMLENTLRERKLAE